MSLTRTQFWQRLKERLEPRYLIYGPEIFMVERCLDSLRKSAREHGCEERISLTVDSGSNFDELLLQSESQSLFTQKKLIEIRLPSGRPGTKGAEALIACMQNPQPDVVMALVPGDDSAARKSKWFKAWESGSVAVENRLLSQRELKAWIENQMRKRKIAFEPGVVDRLMYYFEGNLLAAANEISKLSMGHGGRTVTVEEIEKIVTDQGQFNVFALTDACTAAETGKALRLLRILKNEGQAPALILWALARELRTLCECSAMRSAGMSPGEIFAKLNIWKSRQEIVRSALRRLGTSGCEQALARIARADRVMKGVERDLAGDIWDELERTVLFMCMTRQAGA